MKTLLLILALSFAAFGQVKKPAPKPPPKPAAAPLFTLDAATKDGRAVILSSDGTWKFNENAPVVAAKKDFNIEAAIIYRSGEVVPVARTTFYLLDADVLTIAKTAGLEADARTVQVFNGNADKALITNIGYALAGKYTNLYVDFAAKLLTAIEPHIIQKITTDFQGKGAFANLENKTYHLFGVGSTRKSNAIWNMTFDAAKETSLTLDQNNAAQAY